VTAEVDRSLVSRERELADVERLLAAGGGPITLTGPGGVGKTRLALAIVDRFVARGRRAWFCELASARTGESVVHALAQALSIGLDRADLRGAVELLGRVLARRAGSLVVLDNFEQLAEHTALAETWAAAAPDTRLLVTSRVPLAIDGERVYAVEPLERSGAIRLFVARARERNPTAAIDEGQPVVSELVERLDRLPLAIELAAARARIMSPVQIRDRLASALHDRERTPRHASMDRAIAWTWDLLGERERSALIQLSVVAGSFTVECAEQLVVLEGRGPPVAAVVERLADHGLLAGRGGASMRLRLFETVRQFARAKLDASGRASHVVKRHALVFADRAETFARRIEARRDAELLDAFELERDDVADAYRALRDDDPRRAVSAACALDRVLSLRGPFLFEIELLADARKTLPARAPAELSARLALAYGSALRRAGRLPEARAELDRGLARVGRGRAALRAELLLARARVERIAGRSDEAIEWAEEALAVASRAGERRSVADALENLGDLRNDARMLDEALALFRADGDPLAEAYGEWTSGRVLRDLDRPLEAIGHLERALALSRSLDERRLEPLVLGSLALARHVAGESEAALETYLETARLHGDNGHVLMQAFVLVNLSVLEQETRRFADARTHLGEAARLARDASSDGILALALAHLAVLAPPGSSEARALLADARDRLSKAKDRGTADAVEILARLVEGGEAAPETGGARVAIEVAIARRVDALWRRRTDRPPANAVEPIVVGDGARWISVDGDRIELGRRDALRRIVNRLVEARESGPSGAVAADALVRCGWPGEKLTRAAAKNRLKNAIAQLRGSGLRRVLLTRTDGYLLDPSRPIVRESDQRR
jgi:predicted ATPase